MRAQHSPINRVAASLAPPDTETCLETLHALAPRVRLAELRLDLMKSFDLGRLVAGSPVPLIITCRPPREGGRFAGSEAERLRVLARAIELGCAYVDIEWDSVTKLGLGARGRHRLIVSRHWNDSMPESFLPAYEELRETAAVVKLVGRAARAGDVLPVFELLSRADGPVVALAMGAHGQLTRLAAPAFEHCFLTYAAATAEAVTAPGQLTVEEMCGRYRLQRVGPQTQVELHLRSAAGGDESEAETSDAETADDETVNETDDALRVDLRLWPHEAEAVVRGLLTFVPRLTLTADGEIGDALPSSLAARLAAGAPSPLSV